MITKEIAQIIEDVLWEEHDDCEIKKGIYKECPAKCCYLRAAVAVEAEFQKIAHFPQPKSEEKPKAELPENFVIKFTDSEGTVKSKQTINTLLDCLRAKER